MVLLSAFEPFGGDQENSSQLLMESLQGEPELSTVLLPVTFKDCWPALKEAIEFCRPRVVLALGQSEGSAKIRLESQAQNKIEARIPDNSGVQPQGVKVLPQASEFLSTTCPIEFWSQSFNKSLEHDVAEVSHCAGQYVCNALYYHLLNYEQTQKSAPHFSAVFIHIPIFQKLDFSLCRDFIHFLLREIKHKGVGL